MTLSKYGADFILSSEAVAAVCPDGKVRAYDLGVGRQKDKKGNQRQNKDGSPPPYVEWTIGVGIHSGTRPDSIYNSIEEALEHFRSVKAVAYGRDTEKTLKKFGVTVKQCQFDALTDITFNAGNCIKLVQRFKERGVLTENDFTTLYPDNIGRRKSAYRLWSGQSVTIGSYGIYRNKENTNAGYPHKGTWSKDTKRGGTEYQTPSGDYAYVPIGGNSSNVALGTDSSAKTTASTNPDGTPVTPTNNSTPAVQAEQGISLYTTFKELAINSGAISAGVNTASKEEDTTKKKEKGYKDELSIKTVKPT